MTRLASRSKPYRRKNRTLRRIKLRIVKVVRQIPWLWKPLSYLRKKQKECTIRSRASLAMLSGKWKGYYAPAFDVDRIVWIEPRRVVYNSGFEFSVSHFKGQVIGGDWDLLEKKFDDLNIYAAIRDVCQEGKKWSETVYYQRAQARLNQGLISWGCTTHQEFEQRCKYLERLYTSISTEGYKTQLELASLKPNGDHTLTGEEEIGVNIGRFGDLLFSDGGHRLAISKVLGLQEVPVKVVVRHPFWAELRKDLLRYIKSQDVQRIPPMPHPDLGDIPYNPEYKRLFQVIQADLPDQADNILEIDARFGYFSHRFEEQGKNCYALEEDQEELHFLRALRRAGNRKFQIVEGPLSSFELPSGMVFDAVLVLNANIRDKNYPVRLNDLQTCIRRLSFRWLYLLCSHRKLCDQQSLFYESSNRDTSTILIHHLCIEGQPLMQLSEGKTLCKLRKTG